MAPPDNVQIWEAVQELQRTQAEQGKQLARVDSRCEFHDRDNQRLADVIEKLDDTVGTLTEKVGEIKALPVVVEALSAQVDLLERKQWGIVAKLAGLAGLAAGGGTTAGVVQAVLSSVGG